MTTTPADETQTVRALLRIPINRIDPGDNPRGDLGDLTELHDSIAAIGMQQPLLVEEIKGGRYRLIEGGRRYACAQALGMPYVLGILRRVPQPADRLLAQLAIHTQRRGFDPIAEAKALSTLMFDEHMSREEISRATGWAETLIRDRLALLNLTDSEQDAVAAGQLTLGRALEIVRNRRGTARPVPAPAAAPVAKRTAAPKRTTAPVPDEPHLNHGHRLAANATERCTHDDRPRIGDVACGECWEATIRVDALLSSTVALAA